MRLTSYQPLLIVDDDEDDRYIIDLSLDSIQWSSFTKILASGAQLIEYLNDLPNTSAHPNLILLDYHMPIMNAETILRRLKADNRFSTIKVMIYSTKMTDVLELELLSLGAVSCHQKAIYGKDAVQFAQHLKRVAQQGLKSIHSSSLINY